MGIYTRSVSYDLVCDGECLRGVSNGHESALPRSIAFDQRVWNRSSLAHDVYIIADRSNVVGLTRFFLQILGCRWTERYQNDALLERSMDPAVGV